MLDVRFPREAKYAGVLLFSESVGVLDDADTIRRQMLRYLLNQFSDFHTLPTTPTVTDIQSCLGRT